MKKVLLKVQGINVISDYMVKDFLLSNIDVSSYDEVVYVNTEKEFDKVLKKVPRFLRSSVYKRRRETKKKYQNDEIRTRLEWVDYAVDIWAFFGNKKIYEAVTSKVKNHVDEYREKGYEVDIFSHSLGTMISLHSGADINNFFSVASPMGIDNYFLRNAIHWHLSKCKNILKSKNTLLVWGTDDYVSKHTDKKVKQIFKEHTSKLLKFKTDAGHQLVDIFYSLRKSHKLELFTDYFQK